MRKKRVYRFLKRHQVGERQKGLRGRNSPMCTLSQNGYGDRAMLSLSLVATCCHVVLPRCGAAGRWTKVGKAGSTRGCSQAVPHPSTNRALCRLTSEVRRDPVHSTRYGRQRKYHYTHRHNSVIDGRRQTTQHTLHDTCSFHRSHFGSRYTLGCCDIASLFVSFSVQLHSNP